MATLRIWEGTGFSRCGGKVPQNSPVTQVSASQLVGGFAQQTETRSDPRRGNSGTLSSRAPKAGHIKAGRSDVNSGGI